MTNRHVVRSGPAGEFIMDVENCVPEVAMWSLSVYLINHQMLLLLMQHSQIPSSGLTDTDLSSEEWQTAMPRSLMVRLQSDRRNFSSCFSIFILLLIQKLNNTKKNLSTWLDSNQRQLHQGHRCGVKGPGWVKRLSEVSLIIEYKDLYQT